MAVVVKVADIATKIAPGVWQGGVEGYGGRAIAVVGVDAVALLECEYGVEIAAPAEVAYFPLEDHPDDLKQLPELHLLAEKLARGVREGGRVAILCRQGRNRSGLLTGLTLCALGMDGSAAVKLIRSRRRRQCLDTPGFAEYLQSL